MATDIRVIYHYDSGSWWAESPDIARWSAAADELEQLVALVAEGVPFALEQAHVEIEHLPAPDLVEIFSGRTAGAHARLQLRDAFVQLVDPVSIPRTDVLVAA